MQDLRGENKRLRPDTTERCVPGGCKVEHWMKTRGLFNIHSFPLLTLSSPLHCATGGSLHYSVPLSVWWGWQHIASFHSSLWQVLLVLSHSRPNASILPVKEARTAVLQVLRVVQWGLGGQTVLPIFRIVKSGLLAFLIKHDRVAGDAWVKSVSRMPWMQGVWWIGWVREMARGYHISRRGDGVAWCWWVDCLGYWLGSRGARTRHGNCTSQSVLVPGVQEGIQV